MLVIKCDKFPEPIGVLHLEGKDVLVMTKFQAFAFGYLCTRFIGPETFHYYPSTKSIVIQDDCDFELREFKPTLAGLYEIQLDWGWEIV